MAQIPETVKLLADLPEADFICGVAQAILLRSQNMPAAKLRVNLDTVRRLLRQKKLPGVKIGAQWRVSAAALRTYIEGDMAERL